MQNTEFDELVRKYTQELAQMNRMGKTKSVPREMPHENPNEIANEIVDGVSATVENMPEEPRKKAAGNADEPENNPAATPEDLSGTGYLTIRATSGKEALPEENVFVRITLIGKDGKEHLVSSAITNQSGETEPIALPTVPEFMSQQPSDSNPFVAYTIESQKDGYFTIVNQSVPVFDRQTSVQRLEMIPLPANFTGNTVIIYNEESPNNL